MSKTYGVGVIGAGSVSATYLRLAPMFKGFEIRGVADIEPHAAQKRALEFKIPAMTPDKMLKKAEIDVILNLTVPSAHYRVSMDAISAMKHVYSEKPFVLSLKEGKALKKAADKRGLSVGSAPDTFLGGAHQQARDIIDTGLIGKVASGAAFTMSRGMEHWHPNPHFFFQPGAGPMLDLGPYYLTELVHLIGPVKRVTAFAGTPRKERLVTTPNVAATGTTIKVTTPTTVHGVLEFASGAIVTIAASWDVLSHGHHNIELYGGEGSLWAPDPNFFGGDIILADQSGARIKVEPWAHPFGKINQTDTSGVRRANYRGAGLADMIAAIEGGRPARCGLDLALHAIDVVSSLLKAAETGRVMTLATACERPAPLPPAEAKALMK
jgi:predicted dehydrogenase